MNLQQCFHICFEGGSAAQKLPNLPLEDIPDDPQKPNTAMEVQKNMK